MDVRRGVAARRPKPGFGLASVPRTSSDPDGRFSSYIPSRRARISPTSPAGSNVSCRLRFGRGPESVSMDGTNVTAPTNGTAQSILASTSFKSCDPVRRRVGRVRQRPGAVVNVITGLEAIASNMTRRLRANRCADEPASAKRVHLPGIGKRLARARYRDFTTSFGGPVPRSVVVLLGYQRLRDSDSQPGPIRTFRGNTSRTRFSRSSPGAWLRAGSWFKVFTMSSGPARKRRRRQAAPCDAASGRVGASDESRSDAHRVGQHRVGLRADGSASRRRFRRLRAIRRSRTASTSPKTSGAVARSKSAGRGIFARRPRRPSPTIGPRGSVPITSGAWVRKSTAASIARFPSFPPVQSTVYRNGVLTQSTLHEKPSNSEAGSSGRRVRERRHPAGSRVTITPGLRFDHSRAISQDVPEFDASVHKPDGPSSGWARWTRGTPCRRGWASSSSSTPLAGRCCELMPGGSARAC